LTPVQEGDFDSIELVTATDAAKAVVMKQWKKMATIAAATHSA
jgi:hypothetical protein